MKKSLLNGVIAQVAWAAAAGNKLRVMKQMQQMQCTTVVTLTFTIPLLLYIIVMITAMEIDGSISSPEDLEQAVAIMGSSQLGVELDDSQVSAITAFLHTLTGEQPEVAVPILPASTQDTPRPE